MKTKILTLSLFFTLSSPSYAQDAGAGGGVRGGTDDEVKLFIIKNNLTDHNPCDALKAAKELLNEEDYEEQLLILGCPSEE